MRCMGGGDEYDCEKCKHMLHWEELKLLNKLESSSGGFGVWVWSLER